LSTIIDGTTRGCCGWPMTLGAPAAVVCAAFCALAEEAAAKRGYGEGSQDVELDHGWPQ
jgi:hypothetical protein